MRADNLRGDVGGRRRPAAVRARNAKAMLTAGLKCAPEIGPNVRISTARMAPVGSVLQSSASAPFPPASFARHDARADDGREQERGAQAFGDSASAASRSGFDGATSMRPISCSLLCSVSWSSERDRQRRENADALMQHAIGILERERDFGGRACRPRPDRARPNAPSSADRARPDRLRRPRCRRR